MPRDGSWVGIEKDANTYFARLLFAEYFKRVADDDNTKAWYFSMRGNCKLSLNRHMGLSPRSFAALLLAADFIKVTKVGVCSIKADRVNVHWLKRDEYGLGGDRLGCAEHTYSEVLLRNINPSAQAVEKKLHLIRIGRYEEDGETIVAATAINNGATPPPFTHRLRTIQRWFSINIRNVISRYYNDDRLEHVTKWVEAKEVGLDDSLTYSYNLQSLKDSTQPPSFNMTVSAAAAGQKRKKDTTAEDAGDGAISKYAKGSNYTGAVPKISKDNTELMKEAMMSIMEKYGLTFNVGIRSSFGTHDNNDSDDDEDDESYYDEQPNGAEYNDDFAKDYPLLSQIALPLFGDVGPVPGWTRQNMLRELTKLMTSQGEPLKFEHLNSRHSKKLMAVGSKPVNDVLNELIKNTVGDGNEVEVILKYLTEQHGSELQDELRELKLIPRLLDEYDIAALIDHANLDITQWRKVSQALKEFQQLKRIGVSVDKWTEIGKDAGEVFYDEWTYDKQDGISKPEVVKYWWKNPITEVTNLLSLIFNGHPELNPDDIDYIHICHGGDHGKEKFRFTTKLLIQFKNDGACIERLLPIGDILCKKDCSDVLRGTLIPKIAEGVNMLEANDLVFTKKDGKWSVCLDGDVTPVAAADTTIIYMTTNSYIAGDLAYLACLLGKDGFEGDWCNWCDSFNTSWQDLESPYNLWTIDTLSQRAQINKDQNITGTSRMGVKEHLPFFKIPVQNIIFSVLHAQMGVGNKILNYLLDETEQKVENTPAEMITLRNDLVCAETALAERVAYKNHWEKDDNGGKLLSSLQGKLERREAQLDRPVQPDAPPVDDTWEAEIAVLRHEISDLRLTQSNNRDVVDEKRAIRTEALKQLNEFKKIWKKDDESIYSGIDKILQAYGIERCAYHGGQINGVDVRTLMENAQEIMGEICIFLCTLITDESSIAADDVAKLCKDCEVYLSLWDAAVSSVHEENPSEAHLLETQILIDLAMAKHRELGFSVTPKTHGMEKHVVDQMRRVKGGIRKLIEHWVEHYHQVGHRYDIKWQNQKNELLKAVIRARREYTASHPEVLRRLEAIRKSRRQRKTPTHVLAAAAEKKRIKTERRKRYVDAAKASAATSEDAMDAAQILASLHNS